MPQYQCPWCGRLGPRVREGTPRFPDADPLPENTFRTLGALLDELFRLGVLDRTAVALVGTLLQAHLNTVAGQPRAVADLLERLLPIVVCFAVAQSAPQGALANRPIMRCGQMHAIVAGREAIEP